MSLLSEISKTVVDASIVETESVLATDVTTGSLVAAALTSDTLVVDSVSGANTGVVASGLTLTGTITNSASELAPLLLQGAGTSLSISNVSAAEFGWSMATTILSDEAVTISRDNQNGIYIYYDANALTAARTVTLPLLQSTILAGAAHVYVQRVAGGAFDLTIDAGTSTITGISVTQAGAFAAVSSSTIVADATNSSVHLVHAPDDASSWLIQGLSVGFV